MAFNNIYDLYNQTLETDQPLVDECITAVKTEIENRVTNNLEFNFEFDFETILTTQEDVVKNRVKYAVQEYFRKIGIRFYSPSDSYVYTVEWFIRNKREFMKAYV